MDHSSSCGGTQGRAFTRCPFVDCGFDASPLIRLVEGNLCFVRGHDRFGEDVIPFTDYLLGTKLLLHAELLHPGHSRPCSISMGIGSPDS
jgi:hypothetical protein